MPSEAYVSCFIPLGRNSETSLAIAAAVVKQERNADGAVPLKDLATQWFERQAKRNEERNDDETSPVRRCFTPFRKVGHLTDEQAQQVIAKELSRPGWSVADWLAFFDERAGIFEHDEGLSHTDAQHRAYLHCIHRWLLRFPPGYRPDLKCLHCGDMTIKSESLPIVCEDRLQRWLHLGCVADYRLLRVRDAMLSLEIIGIQDPQGTCRRQNDV